MSARARCSSLVFLSIAVMALAFTPPLRVAAVILWAVGLVLLVAAMRVARQLDRCDDGHAQIGKSIGTFPRRVVVPTVLALTAALAAFGLTRATGAVAADISFDLTLSDATVEPVERVAPSATTGSLLEVAATGDALALYAGASRDRLVDAALASGYEPRSGLALDPSSGSAFSSTDGSVVVRVPLLGTTLPEISAVTFVKTGATTSVMEITADLADADHVVTSLWENGAQTHNLVLSSPDPAGQSGVAESRGLSWSKLNTCLAGAGISWAIIAVIGVTCAAACATAVLCGSCIAVAAGFTGGTISGCVAKAWE